jgi:Transglycosylase SLT domain
MSADQVHTMKSARVRVKSTLVVFWLALAFLSTGSLLGQSRLYSYVGENGLRVITDIPPPEVAASMEQAAKSLPKAPQLPSASLVAAPIGISRIPRDTPVDGLIIKHASRYGLDPDLIRAVIKAESNFNPRAISPKGALGLMQLIPDTARRYGVKNSFDPEQNIAGGVNYLYDLIQMFQGNLTLAISAYNAGENLVNRIQRIPPILETRNYVLRISQLFDFQKSPFLPPEIPQEIPPPKVRIVTHADGRIEITNIESGPIISAQLN